MDRKYRGQLTDRKEWVIGRIAKMFESYYIIDEDDDNVAYEVKPETISHSFGIFDKNGRLVFTKDILKFEDGCEEGTDDMGIDYWNFDNYGVIDFDEATLSYTMKKFRHEDTVTLFKINTDPLYLATNIEQEFEVAGNIFDNPDLLVLEEDIFG